MNILNINGPVAFALVLNPHKNNHIHIDILLFKPLFEIRGPKDEYLRYEYFRWKLNIEYFTTPILSLYSTYCVRIRERVNNLYLFHVQYFRTNIKWTALQVVWAAVSSDPKRPFSQLHCVSKLSMSCWYDQSVDIKLKQCSVNDTSSRYKQFTSDSALLFVSDRRIVFLCNIK